MLSKKQQVQQDIIDIILYANIPELYYDKMY